MGGRDRWIDITEYNKQSNQTISISRMCEDEVSPYRVNIRIYAMDM